MANEDPTLHPVLVAGTGPIGLIAALALARAGHRVLLAGPRPGSADRRTTALMRPSLEALARLGLAEALESAGEPLRTMRIVDATARLVRSPTVTFNAAEIDAPYFGLNVANAKLLEILLAAVDAEPLVERRETVVASWTPMADRVAARFEDGGTADALLVVAADGRASPAREAAGIAGHRRTLPQTALVVNFAHTRDHNSVSTEFHTPTGPFTQVPLEGRRSSLVWVERPERAAELAAMDDASLSRLIEDRMDSMLGRVTVEDGRQTYPLIEFTPQRYGRSRIALVGEAAHVFPPIGAQGMNLGIRDVTDLVDCLGAATADPGADAVLSAYERRRRPDVLMRSNAVNLLNRSLLSDFLPAQLARSAGLEALRRFAPLRAFAMREGLSPGSGFASIWRSRKQVGR